jgi:hypothetical protein
VNGFKVVLTLIGAAVGAGLVYFMLTFLSANPVAAIVVLAVMGVVALLAVVWGAYFAINRISNHHHQIEERRLARQARIDHIEQNRLLADRSWEVEQERLRLEREDRQRRWQLEQQKIELEDKRIKLAAYQAQAVQVGKGQALVIRDYNGLDSRVAYEPQVQVREVGDVQLVSEQQLDLLEGPKRPAINALSLLQGGELDEAGVVLGVDRDGHLVRRGWKQILGVLILGLMGGGKTNTALWVVLQLLLKGYRLALIDRHAKHEESMHARLKDFSAAYDTPVGDSPQAALRVVRYVRKLFEDRRNGLVATGSRLIFVVDEFTATMRAAGDKENEWHPVAVALGGLVEDLNSEGRKFGVHVICIGQVTNASRSGGTEVRDLFHTRIVHGMKAKQAQNLGLTEEKHAIQKLETGEVYLDVEGKEDPFYMAVPEVTEDFKRAVLARVGRPKTSQNLTKNAPFRSGSLPVQSEPLNRSTVAPERPMNAVPNYAEPQLPEIAQRVLDLKKSGSGKAAIILEVWQVKKGGSEAYKQASSEYEQIVENLVSLGYLQAQP